MTTRKNISEVVSSFRDPSGFMFVDNGRLYRQVNVSYRDNYDALMASGLYDSLRGKDLIVSHEEARGVKSRASENAYKILKPEIIPFISYPYEWCFGELKDAVLLTLEIQKEAMRFGMSLKDASAYNIQFKNGKPVLIDTLSFEKYKEGRPWVAYRQFCQHFLAPLALMSYVDVRLGELLRVHIDGIPLDLASTLLPTRTRFSPSLFFHLHLHAKSYRYFLASDNKNGNKNKARGSSSGGSKMSLASLTGLIENLESVIKKLSYKPEGTKWADYYSFTNYSDAAMRAKEKLVSAFLDIGKPKMVWDLGANDGFFSRVSARKGMRTISFDSDAAAVEKNYMMCKKEKETNILPLLMDLTNPSSGLGWTNVERMSLLSRGPADTALALALIHHLAISNNLPFKSIAKFFSAICDCLIIEFVPKDDSQVKKLLAVRDDIFHDYNERAFEKEFGAYFKILRSEKIGDSKRSLYYMERKRSLGAR